VTVGRKKGSRSLVVRVGKRGGRGDLLLYLGWEGKKRLSYLPRDHEGRNPLSRFQGRKKKDTLLSLSW